MTKNNIRHSLVANCFIFIGIENKNVVIRSLTNWRTEGIELFSTRDPSVPSCYCSDPSICSLDMKLYHSSGLLSVIEDDMIGIWRWGQQRGNVEPGEAGRSIIRKLCQSVASCLPHHRLVHTSHHYQPVNVWISLTLTDSPRPPQRQSRDLSWRRSHCKVSLPGPVRRVAECACFCW